MELKPSDFVLTDEQLREIDRKFSALADAKPADVVDPYHVVCVNFEFSPHGKLLSVQSQLCFDEEEVLYAAVKPFTQADVALTDSQLREINHHFSAGLRAVLAREGLYADLGPGVTLDSLRVWVKFDFGPGWRSIEAGFGDFDEMGDDCLVYLPEAWSNSSACFPREDEAVENAAVRADAGIPD